MLLRKSIQSGSNPLHARLTGNWYVDILIVIEVLNYYTPVRVGSGFILRGKGGSFSLRQVFITSVSYILQL
jgi:hypothetical protein